MRKLKYIFVCFIWLMACTATRVKNIETADDFALTNYKTFNFYDITTNGVPADEQYNSRINILQNAIQRQLTAKGLTLSTADPDLLVNIGVVTTEKIQTRQTNFREDAPRYIGQRRYSWKSQEVEVGRYRQGTVTVDLVDRNKNALVWKGVAEAIIPRKEEQLQKTVEEGMSKLFKSL